ncbi:BlaI/MecI/CopY family transcriptional regulator [Gammaproteobacteria bacterium AB-CW1]|uniref:BlaI/MecI/CopY family transcriptional regulator n=1 Tax=Natronospira elongata TaxID=3110268 RepID=A0AAP6MLV6_9GAMM|nr:BlaI/MecI/CopY family transcriptional regulator [Gammaproteobacteria bacterium AB-CW1]
MHVSKPPTRSELKILQYLWDHGPSTVRAVYEAIGASSGLSYTTILKQMQIMNDKGLVTRETSSRAHLYEAVTGRDETQQDMLDDFMTRVYQGSASRMVLQALGMSRPASEEELEEIENMVRELRQRR